MLERSRATRAEARNACTRAGELRAASSRALRKAEQNIAAIASLGRAMKRKAVLERSAVLRAEAGRACCRAAELRIASSLVLRQAEQTVRAAAETHRMVVLRQTPLFVVEGSVEDEHVEARWMPGKGLSCPPPLMECARIVVGLGDTFTGAADGPTFVAALDNPYAALLTVMRAMTRIDFVEVSPALSGDSHTFTIEIA
jgi:hypothetical protein